MKTVITGANGLLGSFITRELIAQGEDVVAGVRAQSDLSLLADVKSKVNFAEADVLDMPQLQAAFAGADTVIHAAGFVSFNPRKRDQLFQVNVEGTRNVVNTCLALGVRKLIHISSVAALGRTKGVKKISEESKWTSSPHNTRYAESKYESELEVFRGMEEGLVVSILNPSVILAPIKTGQSSSQLFTYLNQERIFYGDGVINYVDVRDVARMAHTLTRGNWQGERFIASAGASSMKELFDQAATRMGKRKPWVKVGTRVSKLAAIIEEMRARMLGKEPLLTRESVKILEEEFFFDNQKAQRELEMSFRSLEETLDWCAAEFAKA